MRENTIEKIVAYFREDENLLEECLEQLDAYNGCLGDSRYVSMEELRYYFSDPMDILYRAFYGHDDDTWTTDGIGNREYGPFNPNREYFYFNGYGNLVSSNYKDYSGWIDKWAVEDMCRYRTWIDAIDDNDELRALFDELETEE